MLEGVTWQVLVALAGGAVPRRCEVVCGGSRFLGADVVRVMASSTGTKGGSPGDGESWSAMAVWIVTFLAGQNGAAVPVVAGSRCRGARRSVDASGRATASFREIAEPGWRKPQ